MLGDESHELRTQQLRDIVQPLDAALPRERPRDRRATSLSPVYCGSSYLPSKDYWKLGAIFGMLFFVMMLVMAAPWIALIGCAAIDVEKRFRCGAPLPRFPTVRFRAEQVTGVGGGFNRTLSINSSRWWR